MFYKSIEVAMLLRHFIAESRTYRLFSNPTINTRTVVPWLELIIFKEYMPFGK